MPPPIGHTWAMDVVWMVLILMGVGGLWFLAYRIEPHWSTRDGRRFVCNTQELFAGQPRGRLREAQVAVLADGSLQVTQKELMRRRSSLWQLVGKAPASRSKVDVYLARRVSDGQPVTDELALRIPRSSRCVPILDGVLGGAGDITPTARGTD